MKVGVLGGGQLGRMLGLAGIPLGIEFRFLDERREVSARAVGELLVGSYEDRTLLRTFADGLDVVTFEFENIPADSVRFLEELLPVRPSSRALAAAQDRLTEKNLFRDLDLLTAEFVPVDARDDLDGAVRKLGLPLILKTRRGGYDGKGQFRLSSAADVQRAWDELGGQALIAESFVRFERELSIIAARGVDGAVATYPLIENHHVGGILDRSIAPAPNVSRELQATAEALIRSVLEGLDYVGVLAIELFEQGGRLLVNEMAPRVHNSGHWTIEGATCSQFENHIRAICGLPLGSTATRGHCEMLNLICAVPPIEQALNNPSTFVHLYGKFPRTGRKLGHITVLADCQHIAEQLAARIGEMRRNQI
ncbi:MAG: 5-(carboxyamino)imidazole ribonucleotide synthase [Deltaproteobacteria bacterium]|nr:5-(carboxyamino)imidazole ribonucleotide synthase [Deltaproteobacteria bacterium]